MTIQERIDTYTIPAISDRFSLCTTERKYYLDGTPGNPLTVAGFERNLAGFLTADYAWDNRYPALRHNAAAEQYRHGYASKMLLRESTEREAKRKAQAACDESLRLDQEHRALIDSMAATVKFRASTIRLTSQDGADLGEVKCAAFGYTAVHKSLGEKPARPWSVTHTPSGRLMVQLYSRADAKIAALRLAKFDLGRDVAELAKDKALGNLARGMGQFGNVYTQA